MTDRKCEYCDRKESDGYELRRSRKTGEILCSKHRSQIKRHGETLERTRFDINEFIIHKDYAELLMYDRNGKENGRTIVDIDDVERIKKYKWNIKNKGTNAYVRTTIEGKDIMLHKLLTNTDDSIIIDHKDRNTLNNRKSNLRISTSSQNGMNKTIQSNNTSGFIGVGYIEKNKKWKVRIKINYETISLGSFSKIEDAIRARLLAEKDYFGEFAPQRHLFEEYGIEVDDK